MRSLFTSLAMVLAAHPVSARGADIEVVSTIEGDRGPGFKPAANVMGAVGPKHVVDFTIAGFTVRDKATGKSLRLQSQLEFWRQVQPAKSLDPSPHANDPWMVYDPLSERWFATVAGTGTGESFLAVSSSADPLQPWRGVSLPLPRVDPGLKIGVDRNGVYISCANGGANPREALDLYVIPKADAIDKKGPILTRAQTLPKLIYAAFPAVNFDTDQKPETPAVLLNNEFGGPKCGELYLHRINWTDERADISKIQTIRLSRSYAVPKMEGIQPEGGVRLVQSGGRRNNCAFVRGGSVFSCNGAQRTADSRPGILWYEVRIKDGALLQEGFIDSADCDYLYPSIAVDERGNVGIGCTRTSKADYPSVCVMMHAAGDAAGTMRPPVVAVKGTTVYRHAGVTAMNFSNYSTTCIDPSDGNLLWTFQGYANSKVDRQWCTAWAAFRLPVGERPKTDKQPTVTPATDPPPAPRPGTGTTIADQKQPGYADRGPAWSYDTYDYTETVERGVIKKYRLAIPKGVVTVKGILVVSNCFSGDSRDWYKNGTAYESFINLHDFAFVGGTNECSHYEAYDAFVKALASWAKESGHPELFNVPYVTTGLSAGGGFASTLVTKCPEKTIAAVIVCARLNLTVFELKKYDPKNPVPVPDAVIRTPVLNITGETEKAASVIEPPLETYRPVGALYGWAESPGFGHEYNGQEVLAMPYLEAALKLRYPSTGDVRKGPLKLKDLDPKSGWVADDTTWKSGLTGICAAQQFKGNIKQSSWLMNEDLAYIYRAYATYDRPLKITSPAPQDNIYTPTQAAGSSVTIRVDASKFRGWKKLEFYDGAKLLGTVTEGPTQFTATKLTPGFHTFSVLGTDGAGKVRTSNCTMVAVRK